MSRTPEFHDSLHRAMFDEKGYIVLENFLSDSQVEGLLGFFKKHDPGTGKGFHATSHAESSGYRHKVSEKVTEYFEPRVREFLSGYRSLFSAFTVKEPGADSFFDFHLDWSLVDEQKHVSLSIWCPLVDVNRRNGHLWVLEGSHRLWRTVRGGPGLFQYLPSAGMQRFAEAAFPKRIIEGRAGLAVVYDHRLFHGSPPNLSEGRRVAVNHTMIPDDSISLHYSLSCDSSEIEVFEVDRSFYCESSIFTRPPSTLKKAGAEIVAGKFLTQDDINGLILG